ncbi:MAG: hypothetical protein ACRCZJ_07660 [Erysipelotrichaceae bacterium]
MKLKGLAILSLFMLLSTSGCTKLTEIDMSTAKFNFDGPNGNGYAYIDWNSMEDFGMIQRYEFLMAEIQIQLADGKDVSKLQEEYTLLHNMIMDVTCEWNKENGTFSNGDKAVSTCTFSKAIARKAGYTFKNTKIQQVVEGLY